MRIALNRPPLSCQRVWPIPALPCSGWFDSLSSRFLSFCPRPCGCRGDRSHGCDPPIVSPVLQPPQRVDRSPATGFERECPQSRTSRNQSFCKVLCPPATSRSVQQNQTVLLVFFVVKGLWAHLRLRNICTAVSRRNVLHLVMPMEWHPGHRVARVRRQRGNRESEPHITGDVS